ncbi:MAG: ABC transporter substrate-binding protein [Alicyclobacillus sp.]|nr:ABC transporter substrate-binding protein [Alicyclobacillus sp.]
MKNGKQRVKVWACVPAAAAVVAALGVAAPGVQAAARSGDDQALASLIQKAKKEGTVHGFGMPANWANLGGMWASFSKKYGIKTLYEAEGQMSSAQELEAFKKEKNHPIGDVGDIGLSFGPIAVKMGVVAAYKNRYWNQIPADLKDPNGYWATAYYGVTAFEVNTDKVKHVPHSWKDLLKPEYKGLIGFADPRAAAVSFDAVVAAAYANGGSASNIEPGLQYFKKLYQSKNWSGSDYSSSAMKTGQIAIGITWNYLGQADQQQFKGKPHIQVVVPTDGAVAGPYVEVINKYAPHPNAARLLNEYLFSDEGQISYAKGGAYPIRLKYIKLPKGVHLPPLNMKAVHFLTGDLSEAQKTVTAEWTTEVLGQ